MIDTNDLGAIIGSTVHDSDGDKIGTVGQLYVHPDTEQPTWVSIKTGLFGSSESFVPLDDALFDGRFLTVPYEKEFVKNAPRVEDDGALSDAEEDTLYSYYGKAHTSAGTATGTGQHAETQHTAAQDLSGPNTDDAMTRSEERLKVGTQTVQAGRARLRKYIVRENQSVSVRVGHDEVRVVREPITDATVGAALTGPDLSEEEVEVILTADRVVVDKDVVPVERIRLDKESVTEQQTVTEEVRKEQIELVDPDGVTGTTDGTRTHR